MNASKKGGRGKATEKHPKARHSRVARLRPSRLRAERRRHCGGGCVQSPAVLASLPAGRQVRKEKHRDKEKEYPEPPAAVGPVRARPHQARLRRRRDDLLAGGRGTTA